MNGKTEGHLAVLCSMANLYLRDMRDARNRGTLRGEVGRRAIMDAIWYILRAEESGDHFIGRLTFLSNVEARQLEDNGSTLARIYLPCLRSSGDLVERRLFRVVQVAGNFPLSCEGGKVPTCKKIDLFGEDAMVPIETEYIYE